MTDFSRIQRLELAALVEDLSAIEPQAWRSPTLCGDWDVEEVVAHLGAAATTTRLGWIRSMVGARFDTDVHNQRRLEEFRGADPVETFDRFRRVGPIVLPVKSSPAGLGELLVHAEDIRKPLGLRHSPDAAGLLAVARFFATKDFAVNSRTLVKGLSLRATDADFQEGSGPELHGPLLSLVLVMAGRRAFLPELGGDGVAELTRRFPGTA
ncbi:maleylpyruvate isomerase family mycothiol-dependent enzyme [Amycolatopsis lurida]